MNALTEASGILEIAEVKRGERFSSSLAWFCCQYSHRYRPFCMVEKRDKERAILIGPWLR
jgi:predicted TIM-barrel fold metal-dependent hydrolase